jgi:hypothetical protein
LEPQLYTHPTNLIAVYITVNLSQPHSRVYHSQPSANLIAVYITVLDSCPLQSLDVAHKLAKVRKSSNYCNVVAALAPHVQSSSKQRWKRIWGTTMLRGRSVMLAITSKTFGSTIRIFIMSSRVHVRTSTFLNQ